MDFFSLVRPGKSMGRGFDSIIAQERGCDSRHIREMKQKGQEWRCKVLDASKARGLPFDSLRILGEEPGMPHALPRGALGCPNRKGATRWGHGKSDRPIAACGIASSHAEVSSREEPANNFAGPRAVPKTVRPVPVSTASALRWAIRTSSASPVAPH